MERKNIPPIITRLGLSALSLGSLAGIGCKPEQPKPTTIPVVSTVAKAESTPTTVPIPTEIPATATPEPTATREVKPIPDVITLASLEQAGRGIVVWSAEQTEAARAEANQQGNEKFPLAKKIFDLNGNIQQASTKDALIITNLDPNAQFESPALVKGIVIKAGPANTTMNVITIKEPNGNKFNHTFPLKGSNILIKEGMEIDADVVAYQAGYDKTFEDQFKSRGYPAGTRSMISISKPDNSLLPLDKNNILTDENGNIVVVSSSPLVMNHSSFNPERVFQREKFADNGYLKPRYAPTKLGL